MVTAVISTYKREPEMVERALKSILNQTYQNIETIIVDDSPSTYEKRLLVEAMANSYRSKGVTYIPHEENKGACAARNTGMVHAKGVYIAFLDDDDEWEKDKIEKQLKVFEKSSSDTALVYCGSYNVDDSTGEVTKRQFVLKSGYVFDELIKDNFVGSTSYPLMKISCLREIGGFDVDMPSCQDFDVWLRLAKKYQVNYVDEYLVRYHTHAGECITQNPQKKITGFKRINEKYKEYLSTHTEARWRREMVFVAQYSAMGWYFKAIKTWIELSLLQPGKIKDNFRYLYVALAGSKFRRDFKKFRLKGKEE